MLNILAVGLGGATGAVLRYLVGLGMIRLAMTGFPFGTLAINIVGSFLLGIVAVRTGGVGSTAYALLGIGVLGGFTTFSAFSLETVRMFQTGATASAVLYVGLSVTLSVLAAALGLWVAEGTA